jgi:Ca2+-binding RTX toxin-like protein
MRVDLSTGHYDSWAPGALIGSLIFEVEVVIGSVYNDILIGDGNRNWLYGYKGGDVLKGRGGDDFLFGETGADTLLGGGGYDVLNGGSGVDDCDGEVEKSCP